MFREIQAWISSKIIILYIPWTTSWVPEVAVPILTMYYGHSVDISGGASDLHLPVIHFPSAFTEPNQNETWELKGLHLDATQKL